MFYVPLLGGGGVHIHSSGWCHGPWEIALLGILLMDGPNLTNFASAGLLMSETVISGLRGKVLWADHNKAYNTHFTRLKFLNILNNRLIWVWLWNYAWVSIMGKGEETEIYQLSWLNLNIRCFSGQDETVFSPQAGSLIDELMPGTHSLMQAHTYPCWFHRILFSWKEFKLLQENYG